jgi:NCK-associated protein 1
LAKRLTAGVCYSPLRLGFVTRAGVPFRAEEYADIVELKALARMVGPYGIKLVERELLRFILSNIATIREAVVANVSALEEILVNFHKEAKCTESLRKLRDVDNFVAKSIAVGNALAMRRLMKSALNQVAQDEIPYIVSSVDSMFNQYPPNIFMFPDLLLSDTLALDLGLAPSTSDQALKVVLKKATTEADKKLWELLPVLYAVSFATSSFWKDAQFRPYLEGHLNNCHSLIYTINDLITAFSSITFSSGNVEDIAALQLRFVEISSVILLRMARAKDTKHGPVDFPSVIIFIDRFVQECPLLTEDMLERTLPYTLLRNMYKQIYEDKTAPGKQAETAQDGGF